MSPAALPSLSVILVWALALGACARERETASLSSEWFGDAGRSEPPELEAGSFCATFVQRAEQCGVISGDYRACVDYGDSAERCEASCLERADCRFFQQLLCAGARPARWPAASTDGGLDAGVELSDGGHETGVGPSDAGFASVELSDAALDPGAEGSISATRRCFEACLGLQPFRCEDGRWLSAEARCDFSEQCSDGEDERGCTLCADGTLVERGDACPSLSTCGEGCLVCDAGSCERHAEWGLPSPRFKCRNADQYIRQDWVCNQRPDCVDGSDEADCEVFGRCQNRLITPWEYCNGVDDCGSGEATLAGGSFDEPPWCPEVHVASCQMLLE